MRGSRVAVIAFTIVLGAAAAAAADSLTVVVFDYAGMPHDVLVSAANEGRHAFHSAGVDTDWIFCDPTGGCSAPDNYVQVKILSRPVAATPVTPLGLASTIQCNTTLHCSASYLFFDRITKFSDDTESSLDLTLGYVMAHEIGHLLGLGHRPGGIMTSAFGAHDLRRAASGWLFFADPDARSLRAAVARSQTAGNVARKVRLIGRTGTVSE